MLKIEIAQGCDQVTSRSSTNKKTGEISTFCNQFGYAYLGDKYPIKVKIPIETEQHRYLVGMYKLDVTTSFKVGSYDALEVNQYGIKLIPFKEENK